MKILFIAPIPLLADRGGSIRIYEELKALQKEKIEMRCVTYHLGRDVPEIRFDRIPDIRIYKQMDPGGSYMRLLVDLVLFIKSFCVSLKFKPDIFHGHLHDGGLCAIYLGWFFKRPVILDAQGSLTGEMVDKEFIEPNSSGYKIFRKIESYINRKADRVIVSSMRLKELMENEFKIRDVRYIPDGVNIDLFNPYVDTKEISSGYNLEGNNVLVYTGILSQFQGIDLLLESIPFVIKEVKNLRYLLVGFPRIDYYKKIAEQLGVSDYIIFTGKKSYFEMPKFLAASNIAISLKSSSSTEANLKLFTYMASGLPTVAIDNKENRDVLKDTAIYCQPCPEKVAQAMIWLITHREKSIAMGKRARDIAKQFYHWDNTAKRLIEIYNEL